METYLASMLEAFEKRPLSFLEIATKIGTDNAFWVLSYLALEGLYNKDIQIEPHNPTKIQKWLLLKWKQDNSYYFNIKEFNKHRKDWLGLEWKLTPQWENRVQEVPLWKDGYFTKDSP